MKFDRFGKRLTWFLSFVLYVWWLGPTLFFEVLALIKSISARNNNFECIETVAQFQDFLLSGVGVAAILALVLSGVFAVIGAIAVFFVDGKDLDR